MVRRFSSPLPRSQASLVSIVLALNAVHFFEELIFWELPELYHFLIRNLGTQAAFVAVDMMVSGCM